VISRRLALGGGGLTLLLAACSTPTPPRIIPEDGTIDILTLLRSKPEHTRFVNALVVSGQTSRLGRSNGAVTLFVPTNEAMNGLPASLLQILDNPPANPTAEQRAAAAQLVNANAAWNLMRLASIQARPGNALNTWDRARVAVTVTGARTANVVRDGVPVQPNRPAVAITRGDVLASDGIYHVTNAPILPGA
jgi:uncharacterized surface protein with fasciclin (FAS1) repeats